MRDYLDEICLLLLCGVSSIAYVSSAFAVVGFLLGVIVIGVQSFDNRVLRVVVLGAFCVVACISSAALSFLPLVTYAAMHERSWSIRISWLLPLMVQVVVAGGFTLPLLWIVALCSVGCVLGIKDVRRESEYRGLQRAYDALKEQTFMLSDKALNGVEHGDAHSLVADRAEVSFFEGLTERELAVVDLVAEGLDNREISQRLFLSEGTVRNHISSILSKKNLQNRTQIAVMYFRG